VGAEAREEILARVRAALGPARREATPSRPAADTARAAPSERLVELLVERLTDYRAAVTTVGADGVAEEVARLLLDAGAQRVLMPPALPPEWLPPGLEAMTDDAAISAPAMDEVGHAVTGCALAIAALGSLVFDHGPGQGRRALTLVPDHHVCVVREDQIVEALPEAFARLAEAGRAGRPVTFVSGPSATSDIELRRVEGVHGPRRLDVVIALRRGR
jgi:L-lactate dehydrogenase complex protein LldG